MFILPTRGRPDKLKRLIEACIDTEMTSQVICYLDYDDPALDKYLAIEFPGGPLWPAAMNIRRPLWQIYADHFHDFPNHEFYGFLGDDLIPRTKHWDKILIEAAGKDGVAYGDDLLQGQRLCTHPVVAGDLARKLGWLVYPGLNADTAWYVAAKELGVLRYRPDVILEHMHWINNKAKFDKTYDVDPALMRADPAAMRNLAAFIHEKAQTF